MNHLLSYPTYLFKMHALCTFNELSKLPMNDPNNFSGDRNYNIQPPFLQWLHFRDTTVIIAGKIGGRFYWTHHSVV